MALLEWPSVLRPRNINIIPPQKSRSLTTTLTDFEQVVPVIRPPWSVSLTFANLAGDRLLAYRALLGSFEGRANAIRLPIFDLHHWARDEQIGAGLITHSDGTMFSDATVYAVNDITGVTVTGVQGAKEITVDFDHYGQVLKAGQYFGIGNDCHLALQVFWAGSVATIRFVGSLRHDYTAAPLRLRPFMIARKATDDGGDHDLEFGRWTSPTLDLVETFNEPLS